MTGAPDLVREITESRKTGDGTEPSDLHIRNTRFGGVMCLLAGIAGIAGRFLL